MIIVIKLKVTKYMIQFSAKKKKNSLELVYERPWRLVLNLMFVELLCSIIGYL